MKKSIILMLISAMTVGLVGCGQLVEMPELDDEQTAMVTEYAAGLILKNNKGYEGNYLDEDELAEQESIEAEERAKQREMDEAAARYLALKENAKKNKENESSKGSDSESKPAEPVEQAVGNVAEFYGMSGFDVAYTGCEICDSYPSSGEDLLMAMDATAGKDLYVLSFSVTNNSPEPQNFDMFYRNPNFYLVTGSGEKIHYQATLLLDDMAAYSGDLESGVPTPMVLIFEVPEGTDSQGTSLYMKNGDMKGTMQLQ